MSKRCQKGAATIAFTAIILFVLALTIVYATQSNIKAQNISSNSLQSHQASNAAQAGIDYGIANLIENVSTINDGDTFSATLGNGSVYNGSYTFVGGSNDIVQISSQGTSDAGSSRTIELMVKAISSSSSYPSVPVGGRSLVELRSNSEIRNLYGTTTVVTGNQVDIFSNSETVLASGVSSDHNTDGPDLDQNNATMAAISDNDLQVNSFGSTIADLAATADVSYTNSSDHNYKTELDGVTGQTVYITQTGGTTGSFGSNANMGSSSSPVTILVSGDFEVNSNVEINGTIIATGDVTVHSNAIVNGLVFSLGDVTLHSNSDINGAVVAGGGVEIRSNSLVNYVPSNMGHTGGTTSNGYAIVTGTWKDF